MSTRRSASDQSLRKRPPVWDDAGPYADDFIREYYLSDIGICDRLIDLFKISKSLGFTVPGIIGTYKVDKKTKDSEDLYVEKIPKDNRLIPSAADSGYHSV